MIATVEGIRKKVDNIIGTKKSSIESEINQFLDGINFIKKTVSSQIEAVKNIDELLMQLTWQNIENELQEDMIKQTLSEVSLYATNIKDVLAKKELFVLSDFQTMTEVLTNLDETIEEVNFILFDLRKDAEFNQLMATA